VATGLLRSLRSLKIPTIAKIPKIPKIAKIIKITEIAKIIYVIVAGLGEFFLISALDIDREIQLYDEWP